MVRAPVTNANNDPLNRFKTACRKEVGEVIHSRNVDDEEDSSWKKFGQMMTHKAVHLLSLFLMVYIGVEVTIGGWTASFLMLVRGGGPKSGYVSTGFFSGKSTVILKNHCLFIIILPGLTLGRVILFPITDRVNILCSKFSV